MQEIQEIKINGKLILELNDRQDWVYKLPGALPARKRSGQIYLFVDINGNVFEIGKDFAAAEAHATYPCRVYALQSVSDWAEDKEKGKIKK